MSQTPQQREGLKIAGIRMAFGKTLALDDLSAAFPPGEITGVVGPDGAGKTTLLRIIAGLLEPDAGTVLLDGKPVDHAQLGYMPQHFGLYEDLSVIANMRLQAALRGVAEDRREKLFQRLLAFTSLGPFVHRLAGWLSGGMKQKLGIACALLGSPSLLLLDEPGVGVDPQSRRELWAMVAELRQSGMTILWSTSYMDEAQRCPVILILDHGKALYQGTPEKLMAQAKGDVFLVPQPAVSADPGAANRAALMDWGAKAWVEDALIEGSSLRITIAKNAPGSAREELALAHGRQTGPNLEDAYMTLLGGINHQPSPLSRLGSASFGASSGPKIVANRLTRKFGQFTAASDISLEVSQGQIFGLLGPNGAGKTTTFRMLCGLLKPTSGTCFVDGVNLLRSASKARSRLGYMSQKFSLYADISVQENIRIFGGLYGLRSAACAARAAPLVEALELGPYLKTRTGSLPLGMKQRLSLLCAIIHDPPVIFLDEPTSGVDVRTRRDFWKHISALTARGAAVLVTTHFMEEAEYCDKIALLYRGSAIYSGPPAGLRASVGGNPTLEDAFIHKIEEYDRTHPAGP